MKEHAGIDMLGMYPAGAQPTKAADAWTWDAFLAAAEKCHKAGYAFGLPLGVTTDSVEWLGASSVPSAPSWSMPRATSP